MALDGGERRRGDCLQLVVLEKGADRARHVDAAGGESGGEVSDGGQLPWLVAGDREQQFVRVVRAGVGVTLQEGGAAVRVVGEVVAGFDLGVEGVQGSVVADGPGVVVVGEAAPAYRPVWSAREGAAQARWVVLTVAAVSGAVLAGSLIGLAVVSSPAGVRRPARAV